MEELSLLTVLSTEHNKGRNHEFVSFLAVGE